MCFVLGRPLAKLGCDYFNEGWLAFTGKSLEAEIGDGWADGVHPDDFQRCVDYYLDNFARRQPFEMEYRLRRHDGAYRWLLDRGAPFFDERGDFAGYIGHCVDVDERVHAQAERAASDERALAVAHELERWVLGIVGHDIRNPLGAVASRDQSGFAAGAMSAVARSTRYSLLSACTCRAEPRPTA